MNFCDPSASKLLNESIWKDQITPKSVPLAIWSNQFESVAPRQLITDYHPIKTPALTGRPFSPGVKHLPNRSQLITKAFSNRHGGGGGANLSNSSFAAAWSFQMNNINMKK